MSKLINKWFLSEKPLDSKVSELDMSLNPMDSVRKLRRYKPTVSDCFHYGFLGSVLLFVFVVNPAPWILKILFYSFLVTLFMIPLTSQFFFNALPILTWLALYFTSSYFPASSRPPITVKVLPAIETILYGDNLSDILAASTNAVLDILAWLPYGVFHFGAPFVVAAVIFVFGPPTILRGYAFAFGYMNLFGVIMQNIFPAAPPWYKLLYGLSPANYTMHGSPGGLARIDELLGIDVYTKGFSNSSVIFGAFPSLHSGCATMEALFFSYCFPKLTPLFITYVCWLWWSTMYLTHHYFVDLVMGSVLSYVIFQYTKYYHLPIVDRTLFCRWSYGSIEKYDMVASNPLSDEPADIESIPLTTFDFDLEYSNLAASLTTPPLNRDNASSRSPSPVFDRVKTPQSVSSVTSFMSMNMDMSINTKSDIVPRLLKSRLD